MLVQIKINIFSGKRIYLIYETEFQSNTCIHRRCKMYYNIITNSYVVRKIILINENLKYVFNNLKCIDIYIFTTYFNLKNKFKFS